RSPRSFRPPYTPFFRSAAPLAAAVHEPGRVRVRRLHRRWWSAPTSLLAQREHAALDELVAGRTVGRDAEAAFRAARGVARILARSEEHTSELQSRENLV